MRLVTWTRTPVGFVPTQIDYADYRDVAGVKVPFKRTVSQTYMRMSIELTDVQPNVDDRPETLRAARPGGPRGVRKRRGRPPRKAGLDETGMDYTSATFQGHVPLRRPVCVVGHCLSENFLGFAVRTGHCPGEEPPRRLRGPRGLGSPS